MRLAQDQTPLSIRKAVFVSEEPQGFGIYEERGSDAYKQGAPLLVTLSRLGLVGKSKTTGTFYSLLAVDFEIRSPTGDILTGKDFRKFGIHGLRAEHGL